MLEVASEATADPELLSAAEVLLGVDVFYDEERPALMDAGDLGEINPDELGVRSVVYARLLRMMAQERREDRRAETPAAGTSPSAWNEKWRLSHLTYRSLAAIALAHEPELDVLRRQLFLINNVEQFMDEQESRQTDDGGLQLYADQQDLSLQLARFFQAEPPQPISQEYIEKFDLTRVRFIKGATTEAPTGSGKTIVIAVMARMCGVGKSPEGSARRVRMLLVGPSQEIVEQLAGKVGDDTLRRWASGITFGAYYQHEKDSMADVVVASKAQFLKGCRNGLFFGEEFDVMGIDETHLVTEPSFLRVLQEHWDRPVVGFTATPDYSPTKDARQVLPYIIKAHTEGDNALLDYTQRGRLNGAELYTCMFDPHEHPELSEGADLTNPAVYRRVGRAVLDKMALDFVINQVQEGRRGIVFCEPGGMAKHARELADRLNSRFQELGLTTPDGEGGERPLTARAIGWFLGPKNKQIIRDYHQGKIDVLLTTEKGRQGLNGAFDFVAINATINSFLKLRQIVGRGTRKSETFPFTRYIEFVLPGFAHSIWHAYGLERVEQGLTIGSGAAVDRKEQSTERRSPLSSGMQALSVDVNGKLLSQICLGPEGKESEIPPNYVNAELIAEKVGIPLRHVVKRLRRLGYTHVGRLEKTGDQRVFTWYFEPNAATYFEENPLPPLATPEMKLVASAKAELGMNNLTLRAVCRQQGVVPKKRLDPETYYPAFYLEADDFEAIRAVPVATEADLQVSLFRRETGMSDRLIFSTLARGGRTPVTMIRRGTAPGPWFVPHILAADLQWLRTEIAKIPYADPKKELNRLGIANRSGVDVETVMRQATAAELDQGMEKRKPGRESSSNRVFMYWPIDLVDTWIARHRQQQAAIPLATTDDKQIAEATALLGFKGESNLMILLKKHGMEAITMRYADGQPRGKRTTAEHVRAADMQKLLKLRAEQKAQIVPAGPRDVLVSSIVDKFSLGKRVIRQLLNEDGKDVADMLPLARQDGGELRTAWHVKAEDVEWLDEKIASIPLAGPGDFPVSVVANQLNVRARVIYGLLAKNDREAVTMRRKIGDPYVGRGSPQIGPHIRQADIEWLRMEMPTD